MLPFDGGPTGTQNGTLLLAIVLAAAYLLYGDRPSALKTAVKTLSIVLLALLSVLANAPWMLTAGLILCAAGDFFLAMEYRGERYFLAGLVAFLVGHIVYIVLFATLPLPAMPLPPVAMAPVGIVMVATALAMGRRLFHAAGPLRWPVMVYIAAILVMAMAAIWNGSGLIVAGAASFMLSDTILATERFLMSPDSAHRRSTGPAVWITYVAAQVMILFGVLSTV